MLSVYGVIEAKENGWDYAVLDIKMLESIRAQGAKWVIISDKNERFGGFVRLPALTRIPF